MTESAKFHILSLGGAPRNNTMAWVNEELLVYAGLSDICIARMIEEDLVPEAVLSILHKSATFRSLRLVNSVNHRSDEFEVIGTSTDGNVLVLRFKYNEGNVKWTLETVFQEVIAINKMVDAFGFRDNEDNLTICYSTFVHIEFRFFDKDCQLKAKHFNSMDEKHFIMVNCLNVMAIKNGFLCIFGLTNKKLAFYLLEMDRSNSSESFKPQLLDSREAVWNLDVRAVNTDVEDSLSFEILAGTEERVQIWKLHTASKVDESKQTLTGFALESQIFMKFDGFLRLVIRLDSNILVTTTERLSSVRWDNDRQNFLVSTRENSIKVYSLDLSDGNGIWALKREACSYGEPALELCGIFDACMSLSSKWLLAHNTIGGFYLFKCDNDFNFTPISVYIGGHGGKVRDLSWHENNDILLTVGSDKTARYFKLYENNYWGQRSRPQVHGHEIRCVTSMGREGFISGATEHMFRAFDNKIPCLSIEQAIERIQPLNLTPKQQSINDAGENRNALNSTENVDLTVPLNEELLQSGATVHEEKRKLYAHGNECYTIATTPSHKLAFTSAKGSRLDESQLVVWRTLNWRLEQRITQHTLTITAMSVSHDGKLLLAVSRDRSFSIYSIDESPESKAPLQLKIHQKQAHKRVIWCCSWLATSYIFATGSRDGFVALFEVNGLNAEQATELQRWQIGECVSALDFGERLSTGEGIIVVGTESGEIHLANIENNRIDVESAKRLTRHDGFALTSLIYTIKYNPDLKAFAMCTESGVVKVISF